MPMERGKTPVVIGDTVKGDCGRKWKVVSARGRGTCCWVYHVQLVGDDVMGALKIYKKGDKYEAAHSREAMLLGLARAAYGPLTELVEILDSFTHQGHACLVQELCECDVRQLMCKQERRGLSLYLIQKLAKDLLRGLKPFHSKGFVHADVKPSNLLWSPESACLKLIDFGLTFNVDDKIVGHCQSRGYRAPEMEKWNLLVPISEHEPEDEICTCHHADEPGLPHGSGEVDSRSHGDDDMCKQRTERATETVTDTPSSSAADTATDTSCSRATGTATANDGPIESRQYDINPSGEVQYEEKNFQPETCQIHQKGTNANCPSGKCQRERLGIGTAADMWSVGCVLVEMYTGNKLFDAETWTLLQDAPSEEESTSLIERLLNKLLLPRDDDDGVEGLGAIINNLKDLILRFLVIDPSKRISAEEGLLHQFFCHQIEPIFEDLLVLPTSVLRLLNVIEETDLETEDNCEDILEDLDTELSKYGHVKKSVIPKDGPGRGKVFVQYERAQQAMDAHSRLCGKTFADRSIILTYFPPQDFLVDNFY